MYIFQTTLIPTSMERILFCFYIVILIRYLNDTANWTTRLDLLWNVSWALKRIMWEFKDFFFLWYLLFKIDKYISVLIPRIIQLILSLTLWCNAYCFKWIWYLWIPLNNNEIVISNIDTLKSDYMGIKLYELILSWGFHHPHTNHFMLGYSPNFQTQNI